MRITGEHRPTPPPSFGGTNGNGPHGRPVEVYNLRYLPGWLGNRATGKTPDDDRDRTGGRLLAVASVLLLLLAIAQGYVSFRAQYKFVHAEKGEHLASMLEALGLDAAAVIFALLALAQARLGRPAVAERVLNLACVGGSLAMNALSADAGSAKSVAAWVLPAALYAAASDRLIAVVRQRALAGRPGAEEASPLAAARGLLLWPLRLFMGPITTWKGFRAWVLEEAPVAPGRRAVPARRDLPALTAPAADTPPDTGSDTAQDATTRPVSGDLADTRPDAPADTPPRTVACRKPATKSAKRADRKADKARALLAAAPDMSGAELGRRLKVSERTGSRYRNQILGPPATTAPADDSGDDAR